MSVVKNPKLLITVVALLTVLTPACSATVTPTPLPAQSVPTDTPPSPGDAAPFDGDVLVESIKVLILESFPVQVSVVAKGQVRDGCLEIERVAESRDGDTFRVTLIAERLANARCTSEPQPFEHSFALDVAGLEAGVYTVTVHGVSDTFNLDVDNVLPQEVGGEVISGEANVESIQILMLESFPVQINVIVKGYLPDGCTQIDRIKQGEDAATNTLRVKITTTRPADAMCTAALEPFEEVVSLDVYGLAAGTYTVDVNGVTDTFTFDVDNKP